MMVNTALQLTFIRLNHGNTIMLLNLWSLILVGGVVYKVGAVDITVAFAEGKITVDLKNRWSSGVVPYQFKSNNITYEQQNMVREAMNGFEAKTCIKFKEGIQSATDYVTITKDKELCSNPVGKKGGEQLLLIGVDCFGYQKLTSALYNTIGIPHTYDIPTDPWIASEDPIGMTCAYNISQVYCEEESYGILSQCKDCIDKFERCELANNDVIWNMENCAGTVLHDYCVRHRFPISAASCEDMWVEFDSQKLNASCDAKEMKQKILIFFISAVADPNSRKTFLEAVAKTIIHLKSYASHRIRVIEYGEATSVKIILDTDTYINTAKLYSRITKLGKDSVPVGTSSGLAAAIILAEHMIEPYVPDDPHGGITARTIMVIMTMNDITSAEIEKDIKNQVALVAAKGVDFVWFGATINVARIAKLVFPSTTNDCLLSAFKSDTVGDFSFGLKFRVTTLCNEKNCTAST